MEVQGLSDGLPRASQELFKTAQTMKNLVFPCENHGFSSFALFDDRMLLDSLWSAFWSPLGVSGEPFGEPWVFQSASWAALGGSWARLGTPKRSLGGPKRSRGLNLEAQSAPRCQLGGPKPVWKLNLEAQRPFRSQFWRPKALQDANLAVQSQTGSLTWRPKGLSGCQFGAPEPC